MNKRLRLVYDNMWAYNEFKVVELPRHVVAWRRAEDIKWVTDERYQKWIWEHMKSQAKNQGI